MAYNGNWEDPCGIRNGDDEIDYEVPGDVLEESFEKATRATKVAHKHIIDKSGIVNETYNFYEIDAIEIYSFDFLMLPELTENVTKDDLLTAFHVLQKFGVSFQIIQEESKDPILSEFLNELMEILRQLVCDIDLLLLDLKMKKREKIQEKYIKETLINVTSQEKKIRDIILVRDYEKAVKYVVNILQSLKENTLPVLVLP